MSGPTRTESILMAGACGLAATLGTKIAEWVWGRLTHDPRDDRRDDHATDPVPDNEGGG